MNKLGFGFLRLPRTDPEDDTTVDFTVLNEMVDTFLASGGTYFDTAYTYLGGMSETAVRRALVERYPRSAFTLADKLPSWKVKRKRTVNVILRNSAGAAAWTILTSICCTG